MDIRTWIDQGEGPRLEFKSTLLWNVRAGKKDPKMAYAVLKTIAAFLNTEGGVLLIGVEDDGTLQGMEDDLRLFGGSRDRFEQHLDNLIAGHLGPEHAPRIRRRFGEVEGKAVYVVEVERATEPVYLRWQEEEFYIRMQTSTRSLSRRETVAYTRSHWQRVEVPLAGRAYGPLGTQEPADAP